MGEPPDRPESAVWKVHGRREIYKSPWCGFELIDVELPSGRRFEHEAIRFPRDAVGNAVVVDDRLLMIWRHRLIPDSWGWEIPAGVIDPGEEPADAARRETLEETGWECGPTRPLFTWHPSSGTSDQRFHLHHATAARHVGDPADPDEAAEVRWIPLDRLGAMVERAEIVDGLSMVAVWHTLAALTGR